MTGESSRTPWEWQLVRLFVGGSIAFFVLLLLIYGLEEEGFRQQVRWSARISFTLFCLAFGASSLHHFLKNSFTWWLRMNRKYVGISFAIVHLIHLAFLIILQYAYHPVFNLAATSSLVGGGIAYFFVVMMLITSFDRWKQQLRQRHWKLVHTIGGYWIWSIYMSSYFKRADTEPIHWVPVAILLIILIMRLTKLTVSIRGGLRQMSIWISILVLSGSLAFSQNTTAIQEGILIKNGLIVDGSGAPPYEGSILIQDGLIAEIYKGSESIQAQQVIDVNGQVISPGFIDMHAHGDPLATPDFHNFLAMGVTTIALGMDGSSPSAKDLSQWIKDVKEVRPGVNILPFIGHGTLRRESGIGSSKEVDDDDLIELKALIDQVMETGCWGLSMGLEYLPGYYAGAKELKTLAESIGKHQGLITAHIRNEDDAAIEASLNEMMQLASDCRVNISHFKVVYGKGKERAREILEMFNTQNTEYPITADFYPYSASYTGIGIVFPEWAKNPKEYATIKMERGEELLDFLKNKIQQRNGPEATLFGTGPYKGKTLQDLVIEYNRPYEIILRDIIGPYGASAAYFVMDDELQETLMLDDRVAIGSDGSPTMHHPRGYGTFAKVIEEYVVEKQLLSLEQAIYKMTGLPAQIIGLKDRGFIKRGMIADLTIFQPEEVRNNASFTVPHQLATGINYIFLNGIMVKKEVEFFHRNGQILLK